MSNLRGLRGNDRVIELTERFEAAGLGFSHETKDKDNGVTCYHLHFTDPHDLLQGRALRFVLLVNGVEWLESLTSQPATLKSACDSVRSTHFQREFNLFTLQRLANLREEQYGRDAAILQTYNLEIACGEPENTVTCGRYQSHEAESLKILREAVKVLCAARQAFREALGPQGLVTN